VAASAIRFLRWIIRIVSPKGSEFVNPQLRIGFAFLDSLIQFIVRIRVGMSRSVTLLSYCRRVRRRDVAPL
jgi:hypothetical protein